MPKIKLSDTTLYYEVTGEGEPLLMLHGLGSCGADWMLQIPYFASAYKVITADLRGHGQSDREASVYSVQALSRDMVELLDALYIPAAHVVGLSLGSFVALQLALDYPTKVKSLTLAGSTSSVPDIGYFHLLARKLLLAIAPMSLVAKVVAKSCFPLKGQEKMRAVCEARINQNDKKVYQKLFSEIMKFDVKSRLHEIKCNVLLIAGEMDRLVAPIHAKNMLALLPTAQLEIIPSACHVMPIDSPKSFNLLLERFLSSN